MGLVLAVAAYGSPFLPAAAVGLRAGGTPPPERPDENALAKAIAEREGSRSPSALKDGGGPGERAAKDPQGSVELEPPPAPEAKASALEGPDHPAGWKNPDGEIPSLRTESSKTFDAGGGKLRTEMSTEPVHVREADGSMSPIDTTLEAAPDGRLRARKGRRRVELGRDGADPALASVAIDDTHSVGFGLRGGRSRSPSVVGSTARYVDVREHADLELEALSNGIKETVVLKSPAAPNEYEFPLQLRGLTARLDEKSGSVEMRDEVGKVRGYIPAGFVTEARLGALGYAEPQFAPVTYRLGGSPDRPVLTVTIDRAWLDDPARAFPVQLDPSFETVGAWQDTYANSCGPNNPFGGSSTYLGLGGGPEPGQPACDRVIFMQWDVGMFHDSIVHDAYVTMNNTNSYSCSRTEARLYRVTDGWSEGNLTYNNQPGVDWQELAVAGFANSQAAGSPCRQPSNFVDFYGQDLTGLVRSWILGWAPNHGLSLRVGAPWDPNLYANGVPRDVNTWKLFTSKEGDGAPALKVTWIPDVPVYEPVLSGTWDRNAWRRVPTATQEGILPVRVTNRGQATWLAQPNGDNIQHFVGYHRMDLSSWPWPVIPSPAPTTPLPHDVPPGGSAVVEMRVEPLPSGDHALALDMMWTNNWFPRWFWLNDGAPTQFVGIESVDFPPRIQSVAPVGETAVSTPTLKASAVDPDPAGEQLKYRFWVCRDQAMTVGCISSDATPSSTWTPRLAWGVQHWWRVAVAEGDTWVLSESQPYALTAIMPQDPPLHYGADPYGSDVDGVNLSSGNFARTVTDVSVTGVGPALEVSRTYNSLDTTDRWFGQGWTGPWDALATWESGHTVRIRLPDGHVERYGVNPDGSFTAPPGRNSRLVTRSWFNLELTLSNGSRLAFDVEQGGGRLSSLSDAQGHVVTLTFDGSGRITKAYNETSKRALFLEWTPSTPNHVAKVWTDPVTDAQTGQSSAITVSYTYDAAGRLTSVCGPRTGSGSCQPATDGRCEVDAALPCSRYYYEGVGGRLSRIGLPKGNDHVRLGYNSDGTVAWRENGAGERTTFSDDRAAQAGLFHPLPSGLLYNSSTMGGDLPPNTTRDVVVAGTAGVPTSGVQAVAVNITVHNSPGWQVFHAGAFGKPLSTATSTLDVNTGETIDQFHVVEVAEGKISFRNDSDPAAFSGTTRVTMNVVGWYGLANVPGGSSYHPIAGQRIIDTRPGGIGPYTTPWPLNQGRAIDITNNPLLPGLPTTGVTAVAVDITAVDPHGAGRLFAYAAGDPETPPANGGASVAMLSNTARDNHLIVKVGSDGKFNLKAFTSSTNVVVDVMGWYGEAGVTLDGTVFRPVNNGVRAVDSIPGQQIGPYSTPWGAGEARSVPIAGIGGPGGIPGDVAAVMGEIEVINSGGNYFNPVGVWPDDANGPNITAILGQPNRATSNALSGVQVSRSGSVYMKPTGAAHLIFDVFGYFVRPERAVRVTSPRGKASSFVYDQKARLARHVDELGNTRAFDYNARGFLSLVTDETGRTVSMVYDERGNVRSRTTRDSTTAPERTTWYEYELYPDPDPRNDRIKAVRDARSTANPDGTTSDNRYRSLLSYNADGTLFTDAAPNGQGTWRFYTTATTASTDGGVTPAGLLSQELTFEGATTYGYDSKGNLTKVTNPAGATVEHIYDELGRATVAKETSSSFPAGVTTKTAYDAANRVVYREGPPVVDPIAARTHTLAETTTYDLNGNVTKVQAADKQGWDPSRVITAAFDNADRLTDTIDPVGTLTRRFYDADSNVTQTCVGGTAVAPCTAPAKVTALTYTDRNELATTTLKNFADDPVGAPGTVRDVLLESRSYDPAGRLATVLNARGKQLAYRWVDDTLLASLTLRVPNSSTPDVVLQANEYDPAGHLVSTRSADGTRRTDFTVDNSGRVATATADPAGRAMRTTMTYLPSNRPSTVTVIEGSRTEQTDFTYTTLGKPATVTVKNGTEPSLVTTHGYDTRGLQTSVTSPKGNVSTTTYDELGRVTTARAPTVTAESYQGTPASVQPATTFGYNTFGDTLEVRDARGKVTSSAYDQLGRSVSTTFPAHVTILGNTVTPSSSRTFDALGNVRATVDRRGYTTTFDHDLRGRVVRQTDPIAAAGKPAGVSRFTYDDNGNVITATNPIGAYQAFFYDDRDRRAVTFVKERYPAPATGEAWYYGGQDYDAASNVTKTTDFSGVVRNFEYDGLDMLKTATDATGATTSYQYLLGHATKVIDPEGRQQVNSYDGAGRLKRSEVQSPSPANTVLTATEFTVDADGNVTAVKDPNGSTSTRTLDALGRTVATRQPISGTEYIERSMGYDEAGNPTRETDGNNNVTWQTYNEWNLVKSVVEPSTPAHPNEADRTWTTEYDAGGLPVWNLKPGGVSAQSFYDGLGRLTSQTGSGAEATTVAKSFDYDTAGRLTSISRAGGTIGVTYNDRDLPLSVSDTTTTSYTYDPAGRPLSRADQSGAANFTYDTRGLLKTATDPLNAVTGTYTYKPGGQLDNVSYGTGNVAKKFTYDPLGRLASESLVNGTTTLTSSAYTYDNNGNILTKTVAPAAVAGAGVNTYTYDQANRLKSWKNPANATTNYTWDKNSNRLTAGATTYSYDARNRLTSSTASGTTTTYTWKPRGTLSSKQVGAAAPVTSTFDAFDRPITDGTTTYTYDGLDRKRTAGSTTFGWMGLSQELASDGTRLFSHDAAGAPVATKTGTTATMLAANAHGDIVGTAPKAATALTTSKAYDPWGKVLATTGAAQPSLGYQGDWTDPNTSRVDMNARLYDPDTATFTARDSVDDPGMGNRYGYTPANPLRYNDPTGHCWTSLLPIWGGIIVSLPCPPRNNEWVTTDGGSGQQFCRDFQCALNFARGILQPQAPPQPPPDCSRKQCSGGSTNWPDPGKAPVERGKGGGSGGGTGVGPKPAPPRYDPVNQPNQTQHPGDEGYLRGGEVRSGLVPEDVLGRIADPITSEATRQGPPRIDRAPTPENPPIQFEYRLVDNAQSPTPQRQDSGGIFGSIGDFFGGAVEEGRKFGKAVWDGTWSMGESAVGLGRLLSCNPYFVASASAPDPEFCNGYRYWDLGGAIARDPLGYAKDTGKGMLNWDYCATNGVSACIGFFGPDVVITLLTAGGGKGVRAAGEIAEQGVEAAARSAIRGAGEEAGESAFKRALVACSRSFGRTTLVLMADGARKAIADIEVGDEVLATDPASGETTARAVTKTHVMRHDGDLLDLTIEDDDGQGVIQTTDRHPFWSETDQEWEAAIDLSVGEQLRQDNGTTASVVKLAERPGRQDMWDLTVEVDHNFYVDFGSGAVLVHNTDPPGLKVASAGLRALFEGGGVGGKSIIEIRSTLTANGFSQSLANNKSGYLFTNNLGEEVRIMNRNGGWDLRVRNKFGNYLDAGGNVAGPGSTHGISVPCK